MQIKEEAKKIVSRLNAGEKAITSVVHVAEIANILEDYLPQKEAAEIEKALCMRDTIEIERVDRSDCTKAISEADKWQVGLSDAIAYVLMKEKGIREIYSFDGISEIRRIRG